jgi:hypothetical protein
LAVGCTQLPLTEVKESAAPLSAYPDQLLDDSWLTPPVKERPTGPEAPRGRPMCRLLRNSLAWVPTRFRTRTDKTARGGRCALAAIAGLVAPPTIATASAAAPSTVPPNFGLECIKLPPCSIGRLPWQALDGQRTRIAWYPVKSYTMRHL